MDVTLGSLSLGTVLSLNPAYVKRFGEIDTPLGRAPLRQILGSSTVYELTGAFTGSDRFTNLQKLQRDLLRSGSMKLDADYVQSVVWVKSLKPSFSVGVVYYSLELEDSAFKQVSGCDSDADWSVDSGGGTLSLASERMEGDYSLKLSGTIPGGTASRLKYDPADYIDLSDEGWVSFWFRASDVSKLSSAVIGLYKDASNYASYDFKNVIGSADTWFRVRVRKSDFTETGTMEWDSIDYVKIGMTQSDQLNYYFLIDDLGGFQ